LAMFPNATMMLTTSTSRPASVSARRNRSPALTWRPMLSWAAPTLGPAPDAAPTGTGASRSARRPAVPRPYTTATPPRARAVPPAAARPPAPRGRDRHARGAQHARHQRARGEPGPGGRLQVAVGPGDPGIPSQLGDDRAQPGLQHGSAQPEADRQPDGGPRPRPPDTGPGDE